MLRYTSGHRANVFQARILPESSNQTVVSCAADGQVGCSASLCMPESQISLLLQSGRTFNVGYHPERPEAPSPI